MKKIINFFVIGIISTNCLAENSPKGGFNTYTEEKGVVHTYHSEQYGVRAPDNIKNLPKGFSIDGKSEKQSQDVPGLQAKADPANGHPNENVKITGTVSYNIQNNIGTEQSYTVDQYLCQNWTYCTIITDKFVLSINIIQSGTTNLFLTDVFPTIGKWEDEAVIKVSPSNQASYSFNDTNIIDIT